MAKKENTINVTVNIEGMQDIDTTIEKANRLVELLREAKALINSLSKD